MEPQRLGRAGVTAGPTRPGVRSPSRPLSRGGIARKSPRRTRDRVGVALSAPGVSATGRRASVGRRRGRLLPDRCRTRVRVGTRTRVLRRGAITIAASSDRPSVASRGGQDGLGRRSRDRAAGDPGISRRAAPGRDGTAGCGRAAAGWFVAGFDREARQLASNDARRCGRWPPRHRGARATFVANPASSSRSARHLEYCVSTRQRGPAGPRCVRVLGRLGSGGAGTAVVLRTDLAAVARRAVAP